MKIEKVNDNQIRCTLTRADLDDRHLKLSELAYGTEKAKSLFRDMMQQANYEFGFEAEDMPLMIEAVPLTQDTVLLIITKVEYPEELDTRFSKFSEPDENEYPDFADAKNTPAAGADDILGFFKQLQEKQKAKFIYGVFDSLEKISNLARILNGFYNDRNFLYKNPNKSAFYLVLHKGHHSPEDFNKVCNILSEYASTEKYSRASQAYFDEHFLPLIKEQALQVLAEI